MREPDVNGYYRCENTPECPYLVDDFTYTDDELADEEELLLCPRCTRVEYFMDHERMEQW